MTYGFYGLGMLSGFLLYAILRVIFSRPLCQECGAKAMPNTHAALIRQARRAEKLELALRRLYEETADYITINNLGDIHHNQSMRLAREALRTFPRAR